MAAYLYFFCVVKIVLNSFELYKNPFFTLSPGIWKRHVGGGGGEGEKQFEDRPAVVSFSKI